MVNDSNSIFQGIWKRSLLEMNPRPPLLTCLPKIHKEGTPMRPVVSYINAPAYKLAKKLNTIFRSGVDFNPKFTVKNSLDLIDKIKDISVPLNAKLVSFDVTSLFTNIPVQKCKDVVNRLIFNSQLSFEKKDELSQLMDLCIDQNYFKFNGDCYTQPGVAMGSPLSPLLADIYMDYLEGIIQTKFNNNVVYWYRYVDDVIVLFRGTDRQLSKFFDQLNSIDQKIQFTKEFGGSELNFLDLTIKLEEGRHKFSVFRKPTYTDVVIHNSSNHPAPHKYAAFYSMINRALSVPMDHGDLQKEKEIIYSIAIGNGYPIATIDRIWRKVSRKKLSLAVTSLEREDREPDSRKWVSLPFYGEISQKVGRVLEHRGFRVGFYSQNSNKKALGSVKDKVPLEDRSGVYILKCSCGTQYAGQTGRKFKIRLGEHRDDLRLGRGREAFENHLSEHNHRINYEIGVDNPSVGIAHVCQKGPKLDALESLEIQKIHNLGSSVNDVSVIRRSPLIDMFL